MQKLKTLPVTAQAIGSLFQRFDEAKERGSVEYGVNYSLASPAGTGKVEATHEGASNKGALMDVILFREPWHTDREITIAAARINALHFVETLYVTDMVINQAA